MKTRTTIKVPTLRRGGEATDIFNHRKAGPMTAANTRKNRTRGQKRGRAIRESADE